MQRLFISFKPVINIFSACEYVPNSETFCHWSIFPSQLNVPPRLCISRFRYKKIVNNVRHIVNDVGDIVTDIQQSSTDSDYTLSCEKFRGISPFVWSDALPFSPCSY